MIVWLPIQDLLANSDPFHHVIWLEAGKGPITRSEVQAALEDGRTFPNQYSADLWDEDFVQTWTRVQHVERIAYLVRNPSADPILVSWLDPEDPPEVMDGNHRLAASIILERTTIACTFQGPCEHLERQYPRFKIEVLEDKEAR